MVIPDQIIRSNRKTLSVSISCLGQITVRAPMRCSEERIFAFLQEKERWIVRQKSKMKGAGICLPPENLHGYRFLLLGKLCKICLTDEKFIRLNETADCLFLPKNNAQARLKKWLKDNALRIFTLTTEQRANGMGVSFTSIGITHARGKWGSCSADNKLRFAYRLIYAPKDVIDYVIVHELAHVKHKNHSKNFWSEVEKFVPDYKEKRKWLKEHGILMRIF